MDGTQTGRSEEHRSSSGPLRRVPIGPIIVIAGLFLPTVSLTSCSGVESSASGIALITAPVDEAFPEESESFDGSSRVSQVVGGLVLIIAVVAAAIQVLMRRKVLSSALIVVLSVLGITALPLLDWSIELAANTTGSFEPAMGMVTITAGFGFAAVSSWYWLLSDHDRPHPGGHRLAVVVAVIVTTGLAILDGWPIGPVPFLGGIIAALVGEAAWLMTWTILLLVDYLRSTTFTNG